MSASANPIASSVHGFAASSLFRLYVAIVKWNAPGRGALGSRPNQPHPAARTSVSASASGRTHRIAADHPIPWEWGQPSGLSPREPAENALETGAIVVVEGVGVLRIDVEN